MRAILDAPTGDDTPPEGELWLFPSGLVVFSLNMYLDVSLMYRPLYLPDPCILLVSIRIFSAIHVSSEPYVTYAMHVRDKEGGDEEIALMHMHALAMRRVNL